MRSAEAIANRVRNNGGKVTSQRYLLYKALEGNTGHPTAEELYHQLLPALPGLSLTTVYKILGELVDWGELRCFDTGDGHIHYDPDTHDHAEVVCLTCHKVEDMPHISTPALQLPAEIFGYQIINRTEIYYGYCPMCSTRRPLPDADKD